MPELTKKRVTRWELDGRRVSPNTPGAVKTTHKSRKWYGWVGGKAVPLCGDKSKARQMLGKLLGDSAMKRVGLSDPFAGHKQKLLADHLVDYSAALEAKGDTVDHVKLTVGRVRALLRGCEFVFPIDADAGRASEWLANLRRPDAALTVPPGDEFRPADVAKLLGISGAGVRDLVRRHKLAAKGDGKARRYPRATVEALAARSTVGSGPETVNHYVRAVRGFFRWMVGAKRLASNPLDGLALLNVNMDVRRARRELTAEQLRVLLAATRESKSVFRGLNGVQRFHLYLTAAGTGFRATALASLTPAEFDLVTDSATVTLSARFNKSRKTKVQPLPSEIAEQLRVHLADRLPGEPVWGGTWARDHRGAEMLRADLEAAGIPYAVEGPDGPEYADFHSLRHSYLTLLGRNGVDLRTLMEMAGHSKPELTVRYSHRRLYDLAGAAEKLPTLVPPSADPSPVAAAQELRATGTDGDASARSPLGCRLVAGPGVSESLPLSLVRGDEAGSEVGPSTTQPPVSQGFCQRVSIYDATSLQRGRRDSNPQPPDRQSPTHATQEPGDMGVATEAGGWLPDGCRSRPDSRPEPAVPADPELARLLDVWPGLPAAVRESIVRLAEASSRNA